MICRLPPSCSGATAWHDSGTRHRNDQSHVMRRVRPFRFGHPQLWTITRPDSSDRGSRTRDGAIWPTKGRKLGTTNDPEGTLMLSKLQHSGCVPMELRWFLLWNAQGPPRTRHGVDPSRLFLVTGKWCRMYSCAATSRASRRAERLAFSRILTANHFTWRNHHSRSCTLPRRSIYVYLEALQSTQIGMLAVLTVLCDGRWTPNLR